MINSCESTRKINSFEYVAIPSPRDIFRKYGERSSGVDGFTCTADEPSFPAMPSSGSVIDQMITAQNMLDHAVSANP